MAELHPDKWPELTPQFEARALVERAVKLMAPCGDDTGAAARNLLERALRAFHPATCEPKACEEHAARVAGTFKEGGTATTRKADSQMESMARTIAELEARLKALTPPAPEG
jgi:hypothetical protein